MMFNARPAWHDMRAASIANRQFPCVSFPVSPIPLAKATGNGSGSSSVTNAPASSTYERTYKYPTFQVCPVDQQSETGHRQLSLSPFHRLGIPRRGTLSCFPSSHCGSPPLPASALSPSQSILTPGFHGSCAWRLGRQREQLLIWAAPEDRVVSCARAFVGRRPCLKPSGCRGAEKPSTTSRKYAAKPPLSSGAGLIRSSSLRGNQSLAFQR